MRWLAQADAPEPDEASEFLPEEDFEDEEIDKGGAYEESYGDRLRGRGWSRRSARRS
jgi:hypothetical protein